MFPIESFRASLLKIVAILQQLEIPFHLTGGVTSVAYGEPRLTQDIDIVLQNESMSTRLVEFLAAIENSDFLFEPSAVKLAVAQKKMFQLFDMAESLKLDMYPREMIPGELDRSEQAEIFADLTLPIVSRMDAALSKLVWVSKGSHKSRRDFRQILLNLKEDEAMEVRYKAAELGMSDLMQKLIEEPDEIQD
ncbi:MAG: nucleotidyl transferase AbiEii/AbiGii toxin family protein [Planctomycetota bacterium]